MKNKKVFIRRTCLFLLFIVLSYSVVANEKLDIDDTYDYDLSSTNDHTAFENYDFDFEVDDLASGADLVCYNWDIYGGTDNYGGEDYCIYTSSTKRDQCISCWGINVPLTEH
ncbi:MAG: hypothetical protein AABX73_03045 [Nanoarchaeota archaeon]